jgi:hypothetical protein
MDSLQFRASRAATYIQMNPSLLSDSATATHGNGVIGAYEPMFCQGRIAGSRSTTDDGGATTEHPAKAGLRDLTKAKNIPR